MLQRAAQAAMLEEVCLVLRQLLARARPRPAVEVGRKSSFCSSPPMTDLDCELQSLLQRKQYRAHYCALLGVHVPYNNTVLNRPLLLNESIPMLQRHTEQAGAC